jgi:hypothetical protein
LLVVAVALALGAEPRLARADCRLHELQGFAVVVTTRDGAVVRGWLIRVGPKRILIGRYNNTFVRIRRRNIARVMRDAQRTPARYMRETGPASATSPPKPVMGKITATEIAARERLRKAKRLRNVGIGITISGIVIFVAGWSLAWINPFMGLAIWGVGVGSGIGGITLGVGTPIWTVGSVRTSLVRSGRSWKAKRRAWIIRGLVVTICGTALAGIGAGLVGTGVVNGTPGIVSGSVLLSVGFFTAVHIGIPMWATAHRFRGESPHEKDSPAASRQPQGPVAKTLDPIHEAHFYSRLNLGNPRATVFTTGFRF